MKLVGSCTGEGVGKNYIMLTCDLKIQCIWLLVGGDRHVNIKSINSIEKKMYGGFLHCLV